ncbi:YtxH domain-containing protein [Dehalogenimonas etheniformans]|uniref:YtxH domain-containing protein n=1 Tax=Dehalogenimonas etheniformans TaxID=1536648 RepID=A0A2P5P5P0_9CHLR|nr:YtxH domain-containing protein [Dehalogenimonas etheniformans]PPD57600.1 YtxH domain-containing protein [Dehalogenimonas etheniformans]QNT75940.1 YtxH domain-containing protein [Dehalogenimonas etheniformans]
MEKGKVMGIAAGVLAGAAFGAGAALLLAPQSGRKTRSDIRKRAEDLKARADSFVADIKERDEAFCQAVKEGADDYRRDMMAKYG